MGSCVRPWSCHPPALVLSWAPLLFKSHLQVYETQCMVSYCLFENFTRKDGASWGRGGKTGSLLKGTEGRGAVSTIQAVSPRISSKPSRESGVKPGLCHLEVPTPWTLLLPSPWPMLQPLAIKQGEVKCVTGELTNIRGDEEQLLVCTLFSSRD